MFLDRFQGLEDIVVSFDDLGEPVCGVCVLGVECGDYVRYGRIISDRVGEFLG